MGEDGAKHHVLVAEDDKGLRESLVRVLRFEGYDVEAVGDGAKALEAVDVRVPDAVVLDVMMPVVDGLTACRRLRERHRLLPILMLTARHEVADRVAGLDAGADDYLVKPFALDELLARLRALLRRTGQSGELRFSDLSLDPATRDVQRGERRVELTVTEFNLLELFLRNPRQVLRRSLIYDRVWGYDFGPDSHALDVYVGYLRRKLEAAGEPRVIHTVRGVGFVLRA